MVYIRMEADISALTYPNKRQAVCYPASTGGGAQRGGGGGDKRGRQREEREEGECTKGLKQRGMTEECLYDAIVLPSLAQSQWGQTAVNI